MERIGIKKNFGKAIGAQTMNWPARIAEPSLGRRRRTRRLGALLIALPTVLITAAIIILAIDWRQQSLNRTLIDAIESHKTEQVLALLRGGASPNAVKHEAIPNGPKWLLDNLWRRLRGLPPSTHASGPTALRLAVETDDPPVVEALLLRGARDPHSQSSAGLSLIGKALDLKNNRIVQVLWRNGIVEKEDLVPLLLWAVSQNDRSTVTALLARGAAINGTGNGPGERPFYIAAEAGNWPMMRLLVARGASVNGGGDNLEIAGALSLAAKENDFELARFLLAHGADVNAAVRFGSALTKAAENGNTDMVRLLLAHHAGPNEGDYHNALPILVEDKPHILKLLLKAHANPNVHVWGGPSLLGLVATNGDEESTAAILAAGGYIDGIGQRGDTALMDAACYGQIQIVRLLLRRGAKVNVVGWRSDYENRSEGTALDIALRTGHADIARLLRRWGALRAKAIR